MNKEEINIKQAAEIVGVCTKTIRRWCGDNKLPFRKCGFRKEIRIKKADLIKLCVDNGYDIEEGEN